MIMDNLFTDYGFAGYTNTSIKSIGMITYILVVIGTWISGTWDPTG